ncbi:MAG: bifunctional diaminohydroxyphosphoribosylaminopyrimidine deaminase/5-amino-6-(5-phosphoribosylamino)uracil reductase RibD [Zetaproteobacteria bacterium]|nr:bifunctional diaminohydroxyphosphoribosylaminopyrimidine deaminase/5-amino-6-(5-phosphoribosylamino)uracil reductase RibD [Zetaproteobacteria bacterium]
MSIAKADMDLYNMPVPSLGEVLQPEQAMLLTVQLGLRGLGLTGLNPMVGCCILDRQGILIGIGWHAGYGAAHAEVAAIQQVRASGYAQRLSGAVLYSSLEPCCHHGKTPPCTELIAALPVAKVVYGDQDPNPQVSGKGAQKLRQAGIVVETPDLYRRYTRSMIASFSTNQYHGRAHVVAKAAQSRDGVVGVDKVSKFQITPPEVQVKCHFLRQRADLIAIGCGTARVDNPSLSVRSPFIRQVRQPDTLVVDPQGEALRHFCERAQAPAWLQAGRHSFWAVQPEVQAAVEVQTRMTPWLEQALQEQSLILFSHAYVGARFDWHVFTTWVYQHHRVATILLEGGVGLWEGAFSQKMVDELHLLQNQRELGTVPGAVFWQAQSPKWDLKLWGSWSLDGDNIWQQSFVTYAEK